MEVYPGQSSSVFVILTGQEPKRPDCGVRYEADALASVLPQETRASAHSSDSHTFPLLDPKNFEALNYPLCHRTQASVTLTDRGPSLTVTLRVLPGLFSLPSLLFLSLLHPSCCHFILSWLEPKACLDRSPGCIHGKRMRKHSQEPRVPGRGTGSPHCPALALPLLFTSSPISDLPGVSVVERCLVCEAEQAWRLSW